LTLSKRHSEHKVSRTIVEVRIGNSVATQFEAGRLDVDENQPTLKTNVFEHAAPFKIEEQWQR